VNNFFTDFSKNLDKIQNYKILYSVLPIVFIIFLWFLDEGLAVGLLFLSILAIATFLVLLKIGIKDKKIYTIFLIVFFTHLCAVLFIYFTGFRPFGGGADYELYNNTAIQIADRFSHFNFSLERLYSAHYFPVLIGVIYIYTLPQMIIGQLFTVWLAGISAIILYLLVLEIGGTKKSAFLAGLIVAFYPSYLYFGSLLLKDTLVIPIALSGLLLSVKILKNFSVLKFSAFFIFLTALIHFRFYIGYALLFSFVISWFLASGFAIKKRTIYGIVMIFILGFSPQMLGSGYYGFKNLEAFLTPQKITFYREIIYNTSSVNQVLCPELSVPASTDPPVSAPSSDMPLCPIFENHSPFIKTDAMATKTNSQRGEGSSFVVDVGFKEGILTFFKNYLESFIYSFAGPFPWQIVHTRQLFALIENIPWYLLLIVFIYNFIKLVKREGILKILVRHKLVAPLFFFGLISLGALSLFINNFGIILRIRMPVFISFFCIIVLFFNLEKIYEKIFSYWRSRVYRF